MRLSTRQRRDQILAEVYEKQRVTASGLAGLLEVSEATVRRDLRALAQESQIELHYGEATLPRNSDFSFRSKALRNADAKQIVGRLAADLVSDGEQIFLDSGTTCFEMAAGLKSKKGVSIIANSARLALELDTANLSVILLGGEYRPDRMDTVGPLATATLDQLRGFVAFIGSDGVNKEFGLTASDIESAHLHRIAVRNAREAVLLIDHAKFLAPSLCKIVDWDPISRVVTDKRPSADWMEFFEEKGIEVIYPPSADQANE